MNINKLSTGNVDKVNKSLDNLCRQLGKTTKYGGIHIGRAQAVDISGKIPDAYRQELKSAELCGLASAREKFSNTCTQGFVQVFHRLSTNCGQVGV